MDYNSFWEERFHAQRAGWILVEVLSLVLGVMAAGFFPCVSLNTVQAHGEYTLQVLKIWVLCSYLAATAFSIWAGWMLKKWFPPEDRERYNRVYHKWVVLAINGGMGIACIIYLLMSPIEKAIVPLWILGVSVVVYFATWAWNIIRPHSFWARYRSVIMRLILFTVIAGIIHQFAYYIMPVIAVPVLIITWRNLRRDQKTAGWPDR